MKKGQKGKESISSAESDKKDESETYENQETEVQPETAKSEPEAEAEAETTEAPSELVGSQAETAEGLKSEDADEAGGHVVPVSVVVTPSEDRPAEEEEADEQTDKQTDEPTVAAESDRQADKRVSERVDAQTQADSEVEIEEKSHNVDVDSQVEESGSGSRPKYVDCGTQVTDQAIKAEVLSASKNRKHSLASEDTGDQGDSELTSSECASSQQSRSSRRGKSRSRSNDGGGGKTHRRRTGSCEKSGDDDDDDASVVSGEQSDVDSPRGDRKRRLKQKASVARRSKSRKQKSLPRQNAQKQSSTDLDSNVREAVTPGSTLDAEEGSERRDVTQSARSERGEASGSESDFYSPRTGNSHSDQDCSSVNKSLVVPPITTPSVSRGSRSSSVMGSASSQPLGKDRLDEHDFESDAKSSTGKTSDKENYLKSADGRKRDGAVPPLKMSKDSSNRNMNSSSEKRRRGEVTGKNKMRNKDKLVNKKR